MAQSNSGGGVEPMLEAFIEQAQHLRWDQVPAATRAMVKRELLDYIGAAIAGRASGGKIGRASCRERVCLAV